MKLLLALLLLTLSIVGAHGQLTFGEKGTVAFATIEEGKEVLSARDDFVQRMSPFDRASRLKTDKEVTEEDYLTFVREHVLDWKDEEKEEIISAVEGVQEKLASLSLPLPKRIWVIKTSGKEEGGAAYTRANAIVFPEAYLQMPPSMLQSTFCHEVFHIISRENPELRGKLYSAIGFEKVDELELPDELSARKITNPDAPKNDHVIRLQVDDQAVWAIPVLYSNSEKYDETKGGEFFDYLTFQFLIVDREPGSQDVHPSYDGDALKLVDTKSVSGFFEQVGTNTNYIIHPEEVLADNFALLVTGKPDLPSPEIVQKMETIFKAAKED